MWRRGAARQYWLLDPTDITIATPTSGDIEDGNAGADFLFRSTGALASNIAPSTITDALQTGNVIITTASPAAANGDITVAESVTYTSANNLTLQANRHIDISAPRSQQWRRSHYSDRLSRHDHRADGVVSSAGPVAIAPALRVLAVNGPRIESTGSLVNIAVTDQVRVESEILGQLARITGSARVISAKYVEVIANADSARIENTGVNEQIITTSGISRSGRHSRSERRPAESAGVSRTGYQHHRQQC
jgi:hypothetical protein